MRKERSGSLGTLSSLSRHSSTASVESVRSQRQRDMYERLSLYLTLPPHETLPSAKKNYPTYVASRVEESSGASDASSIKSASGALGRGFRKSVRISRSIFKG